MAKSANAQRHWLVDLLVRLIKTKPLGTACGAVVLALILVSMCSPTFWRPIRTTRFA